MWYADPDEHGNIETRCQAIIYHPIKLSTAVSAAVMGIDRRHTQFAASKGTRVDDVQSTTITFRRNGRFLPEPSQKYNVRNDESYELDLAVYFNQDDEWTETFARDTAKAILSLVAPQPDANVDDFNLPRLYLDGREIPLGNFLDEEGMPLRAAISLDVDNVVYTFEQAARERAYRQNGSCIPNNDMSIDLIIILISEGEAYIAAKIEMCRESPQKERRVQHPNEQGLLYFAQVDMEEMQDAVFYQTDPVLQVVPLPGLRYGDR
ncbi:hypothetical protein QFC20_005959 [Naganishia adeliensis]|uniref:Uncharacterized protein n=1 Tax=Naganishia adeliensis TaxID=92952 RepID=A0ACC2VGB1_9TREE|nr:hypothetical protein QFC20_005959 [Naganishia adeliensis]